MVPIDSSRCFLKEMGIAGEILSTPGHSEDSISLCLDDGSIFVGDLNPLYELEMHRGTTIGKKRRDASREYAFSVQGILDRMEIRGK